MNLRLIFLLLFIMATTSALSAQDIITKKDDTSFAAKVIEITPEFIKYKKFSNIEGPVYNLAIDEIKVIAYENGTKEFFGNSDVPESVETSRAGRPTPDITMDSRPDRKLSDAKLLALTMPDPVKYEKRARVCRWVGWIGAGVFVGVGIGFYVKGGEGYYLPAGIFAGTGVAWCIGFNIASYIQVRKAREIRRMTLVESTIFQTNDQKLNAGITLLSDNSRHNLGIGLRYNF